MGLIRYNVKSGTLPITAELLGSGLSANIHAIYGEGQFTVDYGEYTLKITDNDGCVKSYPISYCDSCPDGYESVNGGCVKYDQVAASLALPLKTIVKKAYNSYGQYGMLIFDEGWNYNGTGTYEKIQTPYWINAYPGNTTDGPLNRNAVWSNTVLIPQDIGFSFCIDLLVEKTYYVGVGCDNWSKLKINGVDVLDQGWKGGSLSNAVSDLIALVGSDSQVPFKYWWVYPMVLKAGRNIIEVKGHNHTATLAGFGMEIYDNSKLDLINATSDSDLNILWKSRDMVGEYLDFSYNSDEGYKGYSCPDGYGIVTCEGEVFCEKKIFIEC